MTKINRVMLADSYKYSHSTQYPSDMVQMFDYMESRGGKYPATIFVGAQYYIKEYFSNPIEQWEVQEAYEYAKGHGVPFDIDGWNYIVNELNGRLPVRIRAVKEGTLVPVKNVLMTIESTDINVPWIAGWLETIMMKVWYPVTVATKSYYVKQMLQKYGSEEWSVFAYHNFGDRGSSSVEAAAIGGMAHMTQFMGTDNFNSLKTVKNAYNTENMPAYSVFASEHSTVTSRGREGEEAFVIEQLKGNPDAAIMSFVADSYDVYKFTDIVTDPNREVREILSAGEQKLVIRPDSGEPIEVLTEMFKIMDGNGVFDIQINGRKASSKYGVLWGDGISPEVIEDILKTFTEKGYAAENFVFGSGGDLMQNVTRDTQRFAVKCSSIRLMDGGRRDVYKDPVTDHGKRSKRGELELIYEDGVWDTITRKDTRSMKTELQMLQTVFEDGQIMNESTFEEVRQASK